MTTASQFGGGAMPVGALVQVAYTMSDPAYLPANGAKVLRATYPLFAATQPGVNTFTYTARTKGAAGTSSAIASHAGLWVMAAPVNANNIQTTPDGITFTQRATPAALTACDVRSLISDGTNVVGVATYNTNTDAFYSADGIAYTKTASAVSCAASSLQCVMAYAATLGTVGRFIVAGGGASFYTSDDRGVTWTTQAHGLGGTGVFSVAWTGTKFIATTGTANTIYTSPTGLAGSWVSQTLSNVGTQTSYANSNSIASDGAGRVVIAGQSALISQDHGVSWTERWFIDPTGANTGRMSLGEISFTNGQFFIPPASSTGFGTVLVSKDAIGWVALPDLITTRFGGTAQPCAFSYKAGVYFFGFYSLVALTIAEDTTRMYLPLVNQLTPSNANTLTYVKVA